jgi:N-acylneuraminate cytidylyltransferase
MNNNSIAIIPARCGSKRIIQKNIKLFIKKPIIAYSIEAALKSNLFQEVMVSTDCEEIAKIALEYGVNVPFYRSKKNSDDFATTSDVLNEVLDKYKKMGKFFKYACCIYPTAVFITPEKLKQAYSLIVNGDLDCVMPVIPFSYPIQRALRLDGNKISYFFPEFSQTRSQDLESAFQDAGQFYFFNIKSFETNGKIMGPNSSPIILSELEAQDIDNEIDWELAELKKKRIENIN